MQRYRQQRACTDIAQLVTAFDNDNLRTPTGPFDYLLDFSHSLFVFDQCLYYISTIIGDAVVVRTSSGSLRELRMADECLEIFRCYVVWKKWYIIAFPCLTCVGAICSFAWVEWCFAKNIPSLNWILMAFAFTLATNLVATGTLRSSSQVSSDTVWFRRAARLSHLVCRRTNLPQLRLHI